MALTFNRKRISLCNSENFFKRLHCIDVGYLGYDKGDSVTESTIYSQVKSYTSILIVLEGQGVVSFGDSKFNVKTRNVLHVPPCNNFEIKPQEKYSFKYCWLNLDGEDFKQYFQEKIIYSKYYIETANFDKISFIMTRFIMENKQEDVTEKSLLSLTFTIIHLLEHVQQEKNTIDDYIEKIVSLINENYENPAFNIKKISQMMHLSHPWLCSIFKKRMNMTMQQMLINLRLSKAKDMLINTDYSVNNIAFVCGFNNALYFSNTFKKAYGLSPINFRKTNKT